MVCNELSQKWYSHAVFDHSDHIDASLTGV